MASKPVPLRPLQETTSSAAAACSSSSSDQISARRGGGRRRERAWRGRKRVEGTGRLLCWVLGAAAREWRRWMMMGVALAGGAISTVRKASPFRFFRFV